MSYLVINGGKKLHGSLATHSAKNSAVAILCASIMIQGKVRLTDVPEIEEVNRIVELARSLGVVVEKKKPGVLEIDASKKLDVSNINQKATETTRASLLLWGAMASRASQYVMNKCGGCHLGERTVRPHWYALKKFGVSVSSTQCSYTIKNQNPLRSAEVVMYESGDTTTENAIMAAVRAEGKSVIKMASANYMVQDLCYFLKKAGAKIRGIGTTTLEIEGVKELKPVNNYPIMPDPIVSMTFISAGITTSSHITVCNCPMEFLELELCKLEVMGQKFVIKNKRKSKNKKFVVADIEIIPSQLTALPDKIYGRPFPGLNIDNLPLFVPILSRASGRTLVHDWAYENRVVGYLELQKMGAKITSLDLHRVLVEGPVDFKPNDIVCPPALRTAVDVLICMLAAPGESRLRDTYMIDRGYENLYEIFNEAGADIKLFNGEPQNVPVKTSVGAND